MTFFYGQVSITNVNGSMSLPLICIAILSPGFALHFTSLTPFELIVMEADELVILYSRLTISLSQIATALSWGY
jgi:hypothetical protein